MCAGLIFANVFEIANFTKLKTRNKFQLYSIIASYLSSLALLSQKDNIECL